MKKYTLVFLLLFITITVAAQEVIATQGDSYSNENGSIDFTIGEVVINTLTNDKNDITQGFHQTNLSLTALDLPNSNFQVNIFPNPTEDFLNIQTSSFKDVNYLIFDALGKLILKDKLSTESTSIDVSELASGHYFIRMNKNGENLKIFKLLKKH